jgi:cell wall-associated NlpC family hydrolase
MSPDRIAEEAAQTHSVMPIASFVVEQAASASSEALSKATTNTISSIASLPPGAAYYLTPRVEQIATETSRVASASAASTDSRSGDEANASSERELPEKSGQVLGNQRGPSEAV